MSNTVDFKTVVDKKDLEVFAKALFEQVTKLQIENRELTEQVAHLEELLMNVPNVLNFEKDRND
jgi:hypothetical protein